MSKRIIGIWFEEKRTATWTTNETWPANFAHAAAHKIAVKNDTDSMAMPDEVFVFMDGEEFHFTRAKGDY